ncbi:MAG: hypothetical protein P8L82_10885 [Paracoccaceae bacterium]|nr:hypothetical protein [Paracoccaceae bacterium]
MDQKLRAELSNNRIFITFGIQVAAMLAIACGDISRTEYIIGIISFAGGLLGTLGTYRTMDDLGNSIRDLDDKILKTNYGKGLYELIDNQ